MPPRLISWTFALGALLMLGPSYSLPASARRPSLGTTQVVNQAVGVWEDISDRLPPQPTGARPITSVVVKGSTVWAAEHNTGVLYRSEDSGATFSAIQTGLPGIFDLHFFDELNGVMISNSKFSRTADGGLTWSAPVTVGPNIYATSFATPLIGYAGGNGGIVYRTQDGGATWEKKPSSLTCCSVADLAFPNPATPDVGFMAIINSGSILFRTTDGGTTWTVVSYQTLGTRVGALTALDFVSPEAAWGVGGFGGILQLKNGQWIQQVSHAPVNPFGEQVTLFGVSFLADARNGWAVGNNGTILHTSDGGQLWTQEGQALGLPTQTALYGIAAVTPTLAFASGYPASVMGGPATDDRRLFVYRAPTYNHHLYLPQISP